MLRTTNRGISPVAAAVTAALYPAHYAVAQDVPVVAESDGWFAIPRLPTGDYTVEILLNGMSAERSEFEVR